MEPGQVAVQLGTWVGVPPGGVETQLGARVDVELSHRLAAVAMGGVQRPSSGAVDLRDSVLGLAWLPVSRADLTVRLTPGVNLPTGGVGQGLLFTPLSTSSFDPWLAADAVFGGAWVGAVSAVARVPLYAGWDLRTQGPFARLDLRAARRLPGWVPGVGVSAARQAPSVPRGASPDFSDLAALADAVVNLGPRWSASARLRVPVWTSGTRAPAGGLAVRAVLGRPPAAHRHD